LRESEKALLGDHAVEWDVPTLWLQLRCALEFVSYADQLRPAPTPFGMQVTQAAIVEARAAPETPPPVVERQQRHENYVQLQWCDGIAWSMSRFENAEWVALQAYRARVRHETHDGATRTGDCWQEQLTLTALCERNEATGIGFTRVSKIGGNAHPWV
jgi:hypothetical protein